MARIVGRLPVRIRAVVAVLGGIMLAAIVSQTPASGQAAPYLGTSELHQAIIDKTFSSRSKSGKPYTMHLATDGTGSMVFANGTVKDPVTWDINGDILCFHGKLSGNECNKVRSRDGKYDFVDSSTGVLNNTYAPE